MTKAKYMYELIEQCMSILCQNNILIENFELRDEEGFYEDMERQFYMGLKFYDEMKELYDRREIDEAIMDQELRTVLALIRQKALKGLLKDFEIFLSQINIPDKKKEVEQLKRELQQNTIDAEYFLKKIQTLRKLEPCVG